MYSDVYNTTVNVNGNTMYSSTFYPGYCCCGPGMYMGSCFGFGFGGIEAGLGFGLGCAAGASLVPLMPTIVKGIGKGILSLWNSIFHKKPKAKTEESQKA